MNEIPDEKLKRAVFSSLAGEWAASDPAAAAAFAVAMPEEKDPEARLSYRGETEKQHARWTIGQRWASKDPQAAMQWISELPETEQRQHIVTAAEVSAHSNPQQAAAYVASQLPAGDAQNEAVLKVAGIWGVTQPSEAAQWVFGFPEG